MTRKLDARTQDQKDDDYVYRRIAELMVSREWMSKRDVGQAASALIGHRRDMALIRLVKSGALTVETLRPKGGNGANIRRYRMTESLTPDEIAEAAGEEPDSPEMQAADLERARKYGMI